MVFAYIDAALGSMVLQAMAGMAFAAIVMGRRVVAAPLTWLGWKSAKQEPGNDIENIPEISAEL